MEFSALSGLHKAICEKADLELTEKQFAILIGHTKSTLSGWKTRPNGAPEYAVFSAQAHASLPKKELVKLIKERCKSS